MLYGPSTYDVLSPRSPRKSARGAIWLIDNYDSFTQNLAHLLAGSGAGVVVVRNDEVTVSGVLSRRPLGIVLSPGPRTPAEAGVSIPLVLACAAADPPIPVLGVCLGHQAIGEAFGGRIVRAKRPVHGRTTPIRHAGLGLLAGLPSPFEGMRYHSLVVSRRGFPAVLEATAWSAEGEIMALRHRSLPIEGLQFHPESYLTAVGPRIVERFARDVREVRRPRPK